MRRVRALLISGCMLCFFVATAQVQSGTYSVVLKTLLSHSVPEVSVNELNPTKNIILLDAREKEEYQVSHIANATYVGYKDFDLQKLMQFKKDEKIIVYCSVGYRSEKIAEKLIDAGFSDVSNLYGGIFEWVNQGRPIVDSADQSTEDIHPFSKTWGVWLTKGNKVYEAK